MILLRIVTLERLRIGNIPHLAERQIEILNLHARGMSNKEIRQRLSIKPQTVKSHISAINHGFQADSSLESVLIAVRLGIIDPSLAIKDLELDIDSLKLLSKREQEVLKAIFDNRSRNSNLIAKKLGIALSTAKSHASSIRRKLGKEDHSLCSITPAVLLWMEAQKQGKV